ncbi:signal transduction histidine kinase [Desulfomonile tiedjei DSM 6799]|uniref:histidine kinase n=2 Tax=Desulfomonile tiedjei TaxID=2358 RepID=I4CDD6_DESTA|nr:signal transduction histidine kinase [Desulfomonile tiedjei DSM 6799]
MMNNSSSSCSEETVNPMGFRAATKSDMTNTMIRKHRSLQTEKMHDNEILIKEIAHDFKNILIIIKGFTELAIESIRKDGKPHLHLQTVIEAATRGEKVVSQMLTLSLPDKQAMRQIDIVPIVAETIGLLRASVPDTVSIRFGVSEDMRPILADATQIHRLLLNLCTNSVHSMRECGGLLHVELGRVELDPGMAADIHPTLKPGSYLQITVSDTGCGIDPDIMERIFEPYFTTKTNGEGSGLGLAVVSRIVKGHGGAITVKSVPGKGTTCQAFLPTVECASTFCPLGRVAPLQSMRKEASEGLLRDDVQHLHVDIERIYKNIEHLEKYLKEHRIESSRLSGLRTDVQDLDVHLYEVISHLMHDREQSRSRRTVQEEAVRD